MTDRPRILTADELDRLSPNERAEAFDERIVTDLEQLPADTRNRIISKGVEIARRLETIPPE